MWKRALCRFDYLPCYATTGSVRLCSGLKSATEVYHEPPARPSNLSLRVYVNPFCPFAQRVRLAVAAKRIPHESIYIHLDRKPSWFFKINRYGLVPVVDHNQKIVRESQVCFDYLDDAFGDIKLWPSDPFKKACQSILLGEFNSKFLSSWFKYRGGDSSPLVLSALSSVLADMEAMIVENNGQYLSGEKCGAVDLLLWPFFERLKPAAAVRPEIDTDFSENKFPILHRWMKVMVEEVEAVQSTLLPFDVHVELVKALTEKRPMDYSLADTTGKGMTVYGAPPS